MVIDIDVLTEVYTTLKQYIPQKDRQEAADNLMSILVDMLSDEDLKNFGATDTVLLRALKEYAHEEDYDEDTDEYDEK